MMMGPDGAPDSNNFIAKCEPVHLWQYPSIRGDDDYAAVDDTSELCGKCAVAEEGSEMIATVR
jgi:hypothetical protein